MTLLPWCWLNLSPRVEVVVRICRYLHHCWICPQHFLLLQDSMAPTYADPLGIVWRQCWRESYFQQNKGFARLFSRAQHHNNAFYYTNSTLCKKIYILYTKEKQEEIGRLLTQISSQFIICSFSYTKEMQKAAKTLSKKFTWHPQSLWHSIN